MSATTLFQVTYAMLAEGAEDLEKFEASLATDDIDDTDEQLRRAASLGGEIF